MKEIDNKVIYDSKESLDYMFKLLDSDLNVFIRDYDTHNKDFHRLLANMVLSVNFHIGCLLNETACYNHNLP